jgi:hypothetical protein
MGKFKIVVYDNMNGIRYGTFVAENWHAALCKLDEWRGPTVPDAEDWRIAREMCSGAIDYFDFAVIECD